MEVAPLASLSLTHVYYDPKDPISFLCAWLALLPQALCITYVTLIWATREVEILFMFAGQMGCEALNFALKRLIKQERPKKIHGKGYGMPSSHAQFMAYFATALALFLLCRHTPLPKSSERQATPVPYYQRVLVSIAVIMLATAVAASRVYLSYHTPAQVLAGCTAGVASALAWYIVLSWFRSQGWVDWVLNLPVVRYGRWRDLIVEEDLFDAGWSRWEQKRKARRMEPRASQGESQRRKRI